MNDIDDLVTDWLTLPDVAERLDIAISKVRQLVADQQLLAVRRGERNILSVPAGLLGPEGLMPDLPGTLSVLRDSGYDGVDALRWLFTADDSIVGGSPIGALHAGHKTEVRRRAQALAI